MHKRKIYFKNKFNKLRYIGGKMPPLIVFLGEGFFLKAGVNTFPPSSPRNYFAIYIFWVLEKVPFLLSPRARMRVDNLPMVF